MECRIRGSSLENCSINFSCREIIRSYKVNSVSSLRMTEQVISRDNVFECEGIRILVSAPIQFIPHCHPITGGCIVSVTDSMCRSLNMGFMVDKVALERLPVSIRMAQNAQFNPSGAEAQASRILSHY
jgi:hypothetical protein